MAVDERRYRLPRLPDAVAVVLRGSPALPSQLLAVAAFLALATAEGGYYPKAWYGAGVFLTGRTTVYLAVVALFSLWRVDAAGLRALLAVLGLGIAVIGVVELLRVDAAS